MSAPEALAKGAGLMEFAFRIHSISPRVRVMDSNPQAWPKLCDSILWLLSRMLPYVKR